MSRSPAAPANLSNLEISLFGHFGSTNFGNEGTLIACLSNLQRLLPGADFRCICTNPARATAAYKIPSIPIFRSRHRSRNSNSRFVRIVRFAILRIPFEIYSWYEIYTTLKATDLLIVPGTGLLTDAFGIRSWGPYNLLKWSLMAKLRGCGLYFISVGAGPLTSSLGKRLVKWALGLADFRSFRDSSSLAYMNGIGFHRCIDAVYPDLAFSLPKSLGARDDLTKKDEKKVIFGIGVMGRDPMYGNKPNTVNYNKYLEILAILIKNLVERGHDVQLLTGDEGDITPEFSFLLNERLTASEAERVKRTTATSVDELLRQVADTDFVVATRFHNVLFALLASKPTISISFHHKCRSLMDSMNLSEYCIDLSELTAENLISKVASIQRDSDRLRSLIKTQSDSFAKILEEQYQLIAKDAIGRRFG